MGSFLLEQGVHHVGYRQGRPQGRRARTFWMYQPVWYFWVGGAYEVMNGLASRMMPRMVTCAAAQALSQGFWV